MLRAVLSLMIKGGWIMVPIVATSVTIWILGLFKLYKMHIIAKARKKFLYFHKKNLITESRTGYEPYDLLFYNILSFKNKNVNFLECFFKEFLLEIQLELSKGLSTISVLITIAPLLGLLGTVAGMIETFKIITIFGVGDPALSAEGISIALLTTEAGLIAAFPAMLLYNFIRNRKEKLHKEIVLDYQEFVKYYTEGNKNVS
ncbi:MAG: MotA/TolQ/ExbB proton channel family protein [Chitinispirillaceae bacterium]|nr:MotA/TolQ/ExbB proton channel family protein [Chitinispirillaceae bacterium]